MKTSTKAGDFVHPCITVRSLNYRRAYVHPARFLVTRVVRGGIMCRLIDGSRLGRGEFKYSAWVRIHALKRATPEVSTR